LLLLNCYLVMMLAVMKVELKVVAELRLQP
jgi:hypothetical protein